jgi:hypothetical protein
MPSPVMDLTMNIEHESVGMNTFLCAHSDTIIEEVHKEGLARANCAVQVGMLG